MPINAHPEYLAAENEYLAAQTKDQKIRALKKMISFAPSHKGAENLRAQLKRRLAKLKYTNEKEAKPKKNSSKQGIKKEDMQAVIVGETNSGKSSLLDALTNVSPQIADYDFTTKSPIVGTMDYNGSKIQIIDIPAIESEYYDRGIVNSADIILIVVTDLPQIERIETELDKSRGKQIIIFNKSELLGSNEKRKISATLQSKKYNFVMLSAKNRENLHELKEKMFRGFGKIRIYTKEPGKPWESINRERPVIMEPNSTVEEVAEKVLRGFSKTIRETRIWGPSSKFPGQKVGLKHKLKDLDTVEFKTK